MRIPSGPETYKRLNYRSDIWEQYFFMLQTNLSCNTGWTIYGHCSQNSRSCVIAFLFYSNIWRITFAGIPPAMQLSGIDEVTTAPEAMMLLLPILTPFKMVTREPIKTFSPITTAAVLAVPEIRRFGSKLWKLENIL